MKFILTLIILLSAYSAQSQQVQDSVENKETRKFKLGVGVNFNGTSYIYLLGVAIGPHIIYYNAKHHLELGPQFVVSPTTYKPSFGIEFTHKYYPNGFKNLYNLYFYNYLNYFKLDVKNAYLPFFGDWQVAYSDILHADLISNERSGIINLFQFASGYGFDINFFDRMYFELHLGIGLGIGFFNGEVVFDEDPTINSPLKANRIYLVANGGISLGYRFGNK